MKTDKAKYLLLLIVSIAGVGIYLYTKQAKLSAINSFEDCQNAGFPVLETYPEQCRTNNKMFSRKVTEPQVSLNENIKVYSPTYNQTVQPTFTIKGEARVFENVFQYRVKDKNGKILVQNHAMANSPDVGQYGPFEVKVVLPDTHSQIGTIEVFVYSAKDGSEEEMVTIPVGFYVVGN